MRRPPGPGCRIFDGGVQLLRGQVLVVVLVHIKNLA